jgi:hypothetical protein
MPGDPREKFSEELRQHCYAAAVSDFDWVVRIDADEFYPLDVCVHGAQFGAPRAALEKAHAADEQAVRAEIVQFWLTLDDVRRGVVLEDPAVSVRLRRRWYSFGHTGIVAWRTTLPAAYRAGQIKNIPTYPDGSDVGKHAGPPAILQLHYPCRDLAQVSARCAHRRRFPKAFGKYTQNLIIDERVAGLHYWDGGCLSNMWNHDGVYRWFEVAAELWTERAARWS